jgi:hypothetical protein
MQVCFGASGAWQKENGAMLTWRAHGKTDQVDAGPPTPLLWV